MSIHIHSEHKHYKHKKVSLTKNWLKSIVIDEEKIPGEINIVFIGDEELREININFLKRNYYTDVISFDYNNEDIISGDIFISYDRIIENSGKFATDKINEVNRVMVHGLLHLLGYDDKSKEEIRLIREKEDHYLAQVMSQNNK